MNSPTNRPSISDAQAAFASWLTETQDLSPHTVRAYVADVAALGRRLGAATPLTALDESSVLDFFEQQRLSGLGSASLRRRASGLHSFCTFLERRGHLPSSPWPAEMPTFRRVKALPRAVPADDLDKLVRHLVAEADLPTNHFGDGPIRRADAATTLLATVLLLTTGLRVAELVSFEVGDLDISSRTIHVMGKGRRERVVYLTNDWITHLAASYLATREHLQITHDMFLFNTAHRPLSTSGMRSRLANAATSAGLKRRVTPHMLRHSAATQLIESGVDIRFVQRLLGHASLATTEIYTHVTDRALREAVVSANVLETSLGRDN